MGFKKLLKFKYSNREKKFFYFLYSIKQNKVKKNNLKKFIK